MGPNYYWLPIGVQNLTAGHDDFLFDLSSAYRKKSFLRVPDG